MALPDPPILDAIVLAAGAATRFGSAKQLLRMEGETLLAGAVRRASEVAAHVIIVLGARAAELAAALEGAPGQVVVNRDWDEGIASSIRAGVASLPQDGAGVLLLLADQAAVTVADLQGLVAAWNRQPALIAAAQYDGITGVPAIFPRACFAELLALKGDTGARKLLKAHPERIIPVPMPHAALDIDTPADWEGFQGATAARSR